MPVFDYILLIPEITLAIFILIILLVDVFIEQQNSEFTYGLTIAILAATSLFELLLLNYHNQYIFNNLLAFDKFATGLKIILPLIALFSLFYSRLFQIKNNLISGEYYILVLASILGAMILISANNLITVFLGLELFNLPVYALVALARTRPAAIEAAMKYFILSALASGMMLYGFSILYGVTGTMAIPEIATHLTTNWLVILSFIFILAGILFKFGAVPFHMWLPDLYEGAPVNIVMYLASASKIIAFAFAYRLIFEVFLPVLEAWQELLVFIIVITLILGNLVAYWQDNIKRLLAYSAIANVGYILMAFVPGTVAGIQAGYIYVLLYSFVILLIFGILAYWSLLFKEIENINDLKNLGYKSPWMSVGFLFGIFSLIGVPPAIGFYGKLLLLDALINANFYFLAINLVLFSVIGSFYYLRLIKIMYFDQSEADIQALASKPNILNQVLLIQGSAIIILGILPMPIFVFIHKIFNI